MAHAPHPDRAWDQGAFVVPCTQLGSIQRVRRERGRECPDVPALGLLAQVWAQLPEWRPRLEQAIGLRAAMRNGVAETIATKNRRKVQ